MADSKTCKQKRKPNWTQEQGHIQAQTGAQRFATVSWLNDMFPGNGVQRGLRYVFSCLVGVSKMEMGLAADRGRVELHSRTGSTSPPLSVAKATVFPRNWDTLKSVAAGCLSCPRVEANLITWYSAPAIRILPGKLGQKNVNFTNTIYTKP